MARPVDDAEVLEGILVGGIISMPGHHIKRRVRLSGHKEAVLVFGHNAKSQIFIPILIAGNWVKKVPWVGQPVCTYGSQVRQLKVSVKDLANVPTTFATDCHAVTNAGGDDGYFVGADLELAHLCGDVQGALLGHYQEIAVCVVEGAVLHAGVTDVDVDGRTMPGPGVARSSNGPQTLKKTKMR